MSTIATDPHLRPELAQYPLKIRLDRTIRQRLTFYQATG